MSSFGEAISFNPGKKQHKKVKSAKFIKGKMGKVKGKNGKPLKGKPKGRKPAQQDPETSGAVPGPSKTKKKEEAVDMEQQFILRMPPVSAFNV